MTEPSKILVVDDEAVIRELMTEILIDEGYDVEAVPSAAAALRLLAEANEFILLFTDIMMPEMDGIQLIREARKIRPHIVPIVMTGFATLETARAAVKEGAYDYVLKPFSLSEIKLAVSNALERYRLASENTRLRELNELFRFSENVATIHDERSLLNFVLRAALDHVGAQRGSIMLTVHNGRALEIAASEGVPPEVLGHVVKIGTGISGWVAEHARPLLVEDMEKAPEVAQISQHHMDRSFISVPLQRSMAMQGYSESTRQDGPRVLAVLNVSQKRNGGQFSESDLKILNILANHASTALDNVRLIHDIERSHLSTLTSMALLIEAKDPYTHGHSERVRDLAMLAARELDLSAEDIELLRLGAGLHDVGKIGVSDGVLNKAERLTDDEWRSIRQHPVIGYEVLAPVNFLNKGHLHLVRHHHEWIDGTGYPDGLKGDQLPEIVRIISVADAYDAMSSDRAYRKGMPPDAVIKELERCSGTQFDARICRLFIDMIRSGAINNVPVAAG